MDKRQLVVQIQTHLAQELAGLLPELNAAEKEERPVSAQVGERVQEIQRQLTMYKFLPLRDFTESDVVCPASLVELQLGERRAYYFVVPNGGGLVMRVGGEPLQVITPQSPLGDALLGKKVGDPVSVATQGAPREYRILSIR